MDSAGGVAGGSAEREYERRRTQDQEKIRQEWGPLSGIAVALSSERQSTTAWDRGATGERRVGAALDRIASESVRVLHDRRIPGSRANIDHLVVTTSTVWVIDAKRYKGAPSLHVEGGLFRARTEQLRVGGRDQTKLADGVIRQMDHVSRAVPHVEVRGVPCFVDAEWPLFGGDFTVNDIRVCWPKRLARDITESSAGTLNVDQIAAVLAAHFRQA